MKMCAMAHKFFPPMSAKLVLWLHSLPNNNEKHGLKRFLQLQVAKSQLFTLPKLLKSISKGV